MKTYLQKLGENPTEENLKKTQEEIDLSNWIITRYIETDNQKWIEQEKEYLEYAYEIKKKIIKIINKHMSIHHIYPRSRTDKFSEKLEENKIWLPDKIHVNLHRLYGAKTPLEQIDLLMRINQKALQEEFHEDIMNLLDWWNWYEMKDWIYLKK